MIQPWILTILQKHSKNKFSHADIQLKVLLLYKEKEALKKCKLAEYEGDFVTGIDRHSRSEWASKLYELVNNHVTTKRKYYKYYFDLILNTDREIWKPLGKKYERIYFLLCSTKSTIWFLKKCKLQICHRLWHK